MRWGHLLIFMAYAWKFDRIAKIFLNRNFLLYILNLNNFYDKKKFAVDDLETRNVEISQTLRVLIFKNNKDGHSLIT